MDEKKPDTLKIEWLGEMVGISPKPGDTLVFMFKRKLSHEGWEHINDHINRLFPDQRVLILDDGVSVGVIGRG